MVDARTEEYEVIELFGHLALFSNSRVDRSTVPDGFYCYDIRHSDDDSIPASLELSVKVNHMGTILSQLDFGLKQKSYIPMDKNSLNFLGYLLDLEEHAAELEQQQKSNIPLPAVVFDETELEVQL